VAAPVPSNPDGGASGRGTLATPDLPDDTSENPNGARLQAGVISLVVGVTLLAVKYLAYRMTGSTAILSDALESIVNVVAAIFALGGIIVAGWPADRSHPYGHGKIEFLSAAFEGGLIAFAAFLIVNEAIHGLLFGVQIRSLDYGILLTLGAGFANAALGWYLIRTGTRHHSLTLVADGKHVLTDFWTSAGVVIGLGLVLLTGERWLDPLVAGILGLNLAWMGFKLVRHAAGGLLDEEDLGLLQRVVRAINDRLIPGIIRVHHLRAIRSGRFTHVDAHLVLPEFWTVEKAHDTADAFEQRVIDALPFDGEIVFHVDPCQRHYCSVCDVRDCPIRAAPFINRTAISLEEAVRPDIQQAS
jgi:cation diffusion facilitator family transporter